ncbi:MAG: hypothetical protein A3H96_14730 [Acidobacteria bacterium RIFCSPLOWO2_02_FULL_67_36]|nr:MAG: hypothetical protein A3H96_14730 [Acidobacteria bacterium RIFCSPLOWO2_02_FULL_67_36]OFW18476.1 MAG: hypothetical protein A3G21_08240 [Acidobacteria bacterium RIFCSPLOWO2_12_FULL_66_21]
MVMVKVNVFEVKAKLSAYLDRAAAGERILICRHNTPVAELRPVGEARTDERPIGPLPGRPTFDVPASFFDPLPGDELDLWEGGGNADPVTASLTGPAKGASKVAETRGGYRRKHGRRPGGRRS